MISCTGHHMVARFRESTQMVTSTIFSPGGGAGARAVRKRDRRSAAGAGGGLLAAGGVASVAACAPGGEEALGRGAAGRFGPAGLPGGESAEAVSTGTVEGWLVSPLRSGAASVVF